MSLTKDTSSDGIRGRHLSLHLHDMSNHVIPVCYFSTSDCSIMRISMNECSEWFKQNNPAVWTLGFHNREDRLDIFEFIDNDNEN